MSDEKLAVFSFLGLFLGGACFFSWAIQKMAAEIALLTVATFVLAVVGPMVIRAIARGIKFIDSMLQFNQ